MYEERFAKWSRRKPRVMMYLMTYAALPHSAEEPAPPPNPPLDSPDLYRRREPPSPGSTSPDLELVGGRARLDSDDMDPLVLAQDTPPPTMATGDQGPMDSCDKACTQTQGPPTVHNDYDHVSFSFITRGVGPGKCVAQFAEVDMRCPI